MSKPLSAEEWVNGKLKQYSSSPNTNIEIDGQEFELVDLSTMPLADREGYVLKPVVPVVKKSEKRSYHIALRENGNMVVEGLIQVGGLTPDTLSKLSEAISALVEYVTTETEAHYYKVDKINTKIDEVRKSFQESQ